MHLYNYAKITKTNSDKCLVNTILVYKVGGELKLIIIEKQTRKKFLNQNLPAAI